MLYNADSYKASGSVEILAEESVRIILAYVLINKGTDQTANMQIDYLFCLQLI